MYYIWDLYNESYLKFETQQHLIWYWKKTFGKNFEQLNVTGVDTFATREHTGKYVYHGDIAIPITRKAYYTRRYVVTDKYNRHQDIRTWPKELWETEQKYPPYTWDYTGRRRHAHRVSGPSMHHRNLRNIDTDIMLDIDELYPDLNKPIRDNTRPRYNSYIGITESWYFYDRSACRGYYKPRCWKNQVKTRKQYQRHDPTCVKTVDKRNAPNSFDIVTDYNDDMSDWDDIMLDEIA